MQIFVINLNRRPDRLARISAQLNDLGLPFTRIPAVDGKLIKSDSPLGAAFDACWQSHQLAFLSIRNGSALILEDDAVLDKTINWRDLLTELERYFSENAIDVLQLGFVEFYYKSRLEGAAAFWHFVTGSIKRAIHSARFGAEPCHEWQELKGLPVPLNLVPNNFTGGSHCYIVSAHAALSFAKLNNPAFLSPDGFFESIAYGGSPFRVARIENSVSSQSGRDYWHVWDSDIEFLTNVGSPKG